jgi:hypothetical protein
MKMFRNLPWLLPVFLGVTILNSCSKVETGLSLSGATSTLAGTAGSSGSTDGGEIQQSLQHNNGRGETFCR